ncbi:hypothetical protein [Coraliomargarita parva]|uniref:hypothetical protein n=1 Tax=Coraliomargarita parva TaxID=3014050 RepID=UPI0022B319A7|nr:hypothetical protein [Coraliomargarita parva]
MSEHSTNENSQLLTFLGSLGAILIFLIILFIAYLPNRPAPVDASVRANRVAKSEESLAAGQKKLEGYEVVDAANGVVRIPIEDAMSLTLKEYREAAE